MLTQKWRVFVGFIYFTLLTSVFFIFIENPFSSMLSRTNDSSIIFFTGALFLVLGKYLVEPFFTKPTDAIVNSISIILALSGIVSKDKFILFSPLYFSVLGIFLSGMICIATKDSFNRIGKIISLATYYISTILGQSKVLFSAVYLLSVYSYFWNPSLPDNIIIFSLLLLYWVVIVFYDFISIVIEKIKTIIDRLRSINNTIDIGSAIGCENPFLYKVECEAVKFKEFDIQEGVFVLIETQKSVAQLGIIINIEHLLNKKWLSVYLITDLNDKLYTFSTRSLRLIDSEKTIAKQSNRSFLIDINKLPDNLRDSVTASMFYQNMENFIGYITTDSDIFTVNIAILTNDKEKTNHIIDGAIVDCLINNNKVRYQIINGKTKKEHLQNYDSVGFTIAIARKLGVYNKDHKELKPARWLPDIYSPVFINRQVDISTDRLREIAINSIGRLPNTDLEIPIKSINDLVTHNTAILGILGIGKSCLTYELIKKLTDTDVKIICLDITNEYYRELRSFVSAEIIKYDDENIFNEINEKYDYIHRENSTSNYEKSGNLAEYKNAVKNDLILFLFNQNNIPDIPVLSGKQIRIYNPDYHKASKGEKVGFNVITTALTQAEKARIIVEELYKLSMNLGISDDKRARILVVFEEAHSLIPEWNSVSNDGDKNAVNGTAKVILQGRKYGLGCFVVTQRTANVSKSILNQCNTIFALRVFDDTGKVFLENYIGSDYTSTLPSLEERHAIIIGKGLKLKQPIIVELNDNKYLKI